MKVLFCKISAMKYYKGVSDKDKAYNGGSFVRETGSGLEEFNFYPVKLDDGNEYCFGFVETKQTRGRSNDLHIEKISGCELMKNEESVDNVLVVWCATTDLNETSIVGWYKNAAVYRQYQEIDTGDCTDKYDIRYYNVVARKEDCVLIPENDRHYHIWDAPVAKKRTYGFGQSMLWYASEEAAKSYIEKLVKQIDEYDGENWIDKSAE